MGAGHAHTLYVHEHSPVHRLAPEVKLVSAFVFVFAVAVTPRTAIWAFAVYAACLGAVALVSRVKLRFVLVRLVAVVPFIAFAFLIPFLAGGSQTEVWGVAVSTEGLWGTWNIVAKATVGATVAILLAATTEIPDLLRGMGVLRVPAVLTSIAGLMVRYLEVAVDQLRRMRTSMTARGYDPRWLWQARPIAASAGALFVRSYERGERVYGAMLSRGFTGSMPKIEQRRASLGEWLVGGSLAALGVVVSFLAAMTS